MKLTRNMLYRPEIVRLSGVVSRTVYVLVLITILFISKCQLTVMYIVQNYSILIENIINDVLLSCYVESCG